jgi:glycosyltransferase involved in cell wall biosynthesis
MTIVPRLPVLAMSPTPWTLIWLNRQQLLSRLGLRGWPVVYSTGALTTWDRRGPRWNLASWTDRRIHTDAVTVVRAGRIHAYWPRSRTWARLEERRFANRLLDAARGNASTMPFILLLSHPQFAPNVELMKPAYLVYHAYDTFSRTPGWTDELAASEEALVRTADLVLASSTETARSLPGDGPKRAQVVLNGVDAEAFITGAALPPPPEISAIPSPRIGYIGRLSNKLDFALIARLAAARPEWHWVLLGPLLADPTPGLDACRTRPNVHFLGERAFSALPRYSAHMDVNTIPYRMDNGWWHGISPLKLHEYLAAGRPVVVADVGIELPDPALVSVARTPEGWEQAIDAAIRSAATFDPAPHRRVARANSWDHRVDQLEALLFGCIEGSVAPARGDACAR